MPSLSSDDRWSSPSLSHAEKECGNSDLDHHPFLSLQQQIAQVIQQQSKESRALQKQVQSLAAEQARLFAALTRRHEEILQRLPPVSGGSVTNGGEPVREIQLSLDNGSLIPTNPPSVMPSAHDQKLEETTNGPAKVSAEQRTSSIVVASGRGVHLDVSKLPQTWAAERIDASAEAQAGKYWFRRAQSCVKSGIFDFVFVAVVFINLGTMYVQLHYRSYHIAMLMGLRDNDNGWSQKKDFFEILELVYTSIFGIELALRLTFLGWEYIRVAANCFDSIIVVISCLQMYIMQPLGVMSDASFIAIARVVRLIRVFRLLKVVRYAEACTQIRILVKALCSSVGSLFWSMFLLGMILVSSSVLLNKMVLLYVEDERNPLMLREWAHSNFGTTILSMIALWECTFTGSWHRYSRTMILEMNGLYAFFWVPYTLCINFSVMKLIGALYLKETMAAAAVDAERMSVAKMKRKREFAHEISAIFKEVDGDSNGKLSASEFEAMLSNERVGTLFEKLELEVSEVAVLFELLAADTGEANYDEFVEGALKLKQTPMTIDIIQLIHGNEVLAQALQTLQEELCDLGNAVGVAVNKKALGTAQYHFLSQHEPDSPDKGGTSTPYHQCSSILED